MRLLLVMGACACVAGLGGCDGTDSDPTTIEDAGTGDAGLDGPENCPDPTDPRVHYRSADPSMCIGVTLDCTTEQNGFQNACGCGCIDKGDPMCPAPDNPDVTWISHDPDECSPEIPDCPENELGFSNSCGCGCVLPGG
jgi:hypothetical protein